jgi:subfamily B ATP-binding cassette protein MsbA
MSEASTPQDGVQLYRRLLRYVLPHWRPFVVALLAMAFVASTETAFAALMKPLLDGSFIKRDETMIRLAPLLLIGLFLVRGFASYLSEYWMGWVARMVIKTIRGQMFRKLLCLPVTFYDNVTSGQLISKLIYDVEQVAMAATSSITVLVRDTLTVIGLIGWMFYINWLLALIMMLGAPVVAKLNTSISRRFRRYSRRIQGSMGDVTQIAGESIEGQQVVKSFGGQTYEEGRFEQANEHNRKLNMKLRATSAASTPVIQLISAVSSAGVIYIASLQTDMSVGTFVSFVTAMMMILSPLKRLTKVNVTMQRGIAAAGSVFGLIDLPPEEDSGQRNLGRSRGEVEYRHVRFAYDPRKGNVIDDVSFRAEAGHTVAFVGRSGSGKSTLASLLPRFYDVQGGEILIDGVPIREIGLENLRDQVALVTQHVTLFNDTIANNIAYGRLEGASEKEIIAAAEAAHAMEFIRDLPEGLNTMIGENGVLLSGGQRQRLAIARALLKDAPILILDEATSALDTESERHIQAALEEVMRNRTTLVIAHRLSTIQKADKIIVMAQGRVIESGSHAELLASGGHYASLYRLQFEGAGTQPLPV